jgi:hypothetical protein
MRRLVPVKPLFALITLCLVVIGLWYGWYKYVTSTLPDSAKMTDEQVKVLAARGQLGDLFGGVNALFTALLLAGALYTVWLQLRQITTLQDQLLAQDRANQETVRIQAMTALVSARSTLMHARYNFNRDLASAAREKRIDESLRPAWEVMQFSNAEAMGKDFQSLQELASELDRILRRESEGEEGSV